MDSKELLDVCLRARTASETELVAARAALARHPDNLKARALLLGAAQPPDRYRHVFWFIEHQPEKWLLSFSVIPPDAPEYVVAAELWARSIESSGGRNIAVVINAARYHFFAEPEKAEALMLSLLKSADTAQSRAAIAKFYGEWHVFLTASLRELEAVTIAERALRARISSFALQLPAYRLGELTALREYTRVAPNPDFVRLRDLATEETQLALAVSDSDARDSYLHSAAGLLFLGVSDIPSAVRELAALRPVQAAAALRLPFEFIRADLIEDALRFAARCDAAGLDSSGLRTAINAHRTTKVPNP